MTTTESRHTDRPRQPRLDRGLAMQLAAQEYDRFLAVLRTLTAEQWAAATDCPDWDVRAMAAHVLGAAQAHASIRENVHQLRLAKKDASGRAFEAALSAVQVRERADLSPADIVRGLERTAPKSVRARKRLPGLIRRRTLGPEQTGSDPWSLAYLLDVIYTRDSWMHRVDITRATGRALELTADHDGVLVADVAAEWAERHGRPYDLTLTGPAGGHWSHGSGGPAYELDAVEFCRILSGRASGDGLLTTEVPF